MRRALLLACWLIAAPAAAEQVAAVTSPNGKARISLALSERGALVSSVSWAGRPVISDARLALDLVQGGVLGEGVRATGVTRPSSRCTWPTRAGSRCCRTRRPPTVDRRGRSS